jgi:hypothetical protein
MALRVEEEDRVSRMSRREILESSGAGMGGAALCGFGMGRAGAQGHRLFHQGSGTTGS